MAVTPVNIVLQTTNKYLQTLLTSSKLDALGITIIYEDFTFSTTLNLGYSVLEYG